MNDHVIFSVVLLTVLLFGILIVLLKYYYQEGQTWKRIIKETSIVVKTSIGIIILFSVLFVVMYINSPNNLPVIPYKSSEVEDIIDVGDGIIAVGRSRGTYGNTTSHSYNTTRALIIKYDYDGEIIWEDMYHVESDAELASRFYSVEVDGDNYVVSGTVGGYYDGFSYVEITYNDDGEVITETYIESDFEGIKTYNLNDSNTIDLEFIRLDYTVFTIEVIKNKNLNDEKRVLHTLEVEDNVQTNLYYENIYVIYSTDEVIVVGVGLVNVDQETVYNKLLVLDANLALIDEVDLNDEAMPGNLVPVEGGYYMLSRNQQARKSFMISFDSDFNMIQHIPIGTFTEYFMANDIVFSNDEIYIGGNEYLTQTKEGFTEYFSGKVFVYDYDWNLIDTIDMKKGVSINSLILVDKEIYTGGQFNTTIGVPSYSSYINNPWCGSFSKIDSKDRNYVLDFFN